jgi:RNA polymerase primary sigma factor
LKLTKQFTNRESKSLDQYLQEIGKVDLISPEEEIELAKKIKKGDRIALERLTKANLRFVVSVAKQFQNQGLALGDLINEGNMGLIKAAERFDETRGFKFISYAVWWIRQSIMQAIAEQSRLVRLPLNRIGTLNKLNRAYRELEQEYERKPNAEELARFLEMNKEDILSAIEHYGRHISVDAPLKTSEENKNSLLDVLTNDKNPSPDNDLMTESLKKEIKTILSALNGKEAEVIKLYYGIDTERSATLEEIGERFNLTRERVRQIKEKAIRTLRHAPKAKNLRVFLG